MPKPEIPEARRECARVDRVEMGKTAGLDRRHFAAFLASLGLGGVALWFLAGKDAYVIVPEKESPEQATSYIIFIDASDENKIKARNGLTGKIEFSGADATAVIQNTINALTPARTWMEEVVLRGAFTDLGQISLPSYTRLRIQGAITAKAGLNTTFLVGVDGATMIELIGGKVDGNGPNQTANSNVIYLSNATRCRIQDCYIKGAKAINEAGECIWLHNCKHVVIAGNYIELYPRSANYVVLKGATENCQIVDNVCDGTNGTWCCAIEVSEWSTLNIVRGNIIYSPYSSGSPISFLNGINNLVEGNVITAGGLAGIQMTDNSSYNLVVGNYVFNALKGIRTFWSSGGTATRNVFRQNYVKNPDTAGAVGIEVQANGRFTQVVGNTIVGGMDVDTGISVLAGAEDTWIEENDLGDDALDTRIWDSGTRTAIRRNRGYVTENAGMATFSGTGTQTAFTIRHDLAGTPGVALASAGSSDATGDFYLTCDGTEITARYLRARPVGSNNVVLRWFAQM